MISIVIEARILLPVKIAGGALPTERQHDLAMPYLKSPGW